MRPQHDERATSQSFQDLRQSIFQELAPPPTLKVSEWANRNRILPKGSGPKPGQWQTHSFQREMMDAALDPGVREVVFMTSTQIVKSEALNNIAGYFIDAEPKPILMVQPTDGTAMAYSKKRIAPMIANCPALYRKVRHAISRQPGNTVLLKEFDGGFLRLAGANSGPGLRSDPIEVLLLDEIDGYPDDVNGEGDPIVLATRRTESFAFPVIVKASTPSKPRGFSKIEKAYLKSDQRRFHVPCPFCTRLQPLEWRDEAGAYHLIYEKDAQGELIPESVRYLCAGCGKGIPEKFKYGMLEEGHWVAGRPEIHSVAGFHLNALYSPWKMNWVELAQEWIGTKDNPEGLRAFVNTRLAETYNEGAITAIGAPALLTRREKYPDQGLPAGVAVLIGSADIQNTRIEAQTVGFGIGEEAWLIDRQRFDGNPSMTQDPEAAANVWRQLDEFFLSSYTHPSGIELSPALCLVDAGAHTDSVYDYVLPRQHAGRRVFACKGMDFLGKIGLVTEGTTKRAKIRLFLVATYAAKDRIFGRLQIPKPGPGYIHFPPWVDEGYFNELTSEVKVPRINKRTRVVRYEYRKIQERNEALDQMVYSHGGLAVLQRFVAPAIYRDLAAVHAAITKGQRPESLIPPRIRRMRSAPLYAPIAL
jgi:phage terminase large subunit GpA-like protein